jgi:hypothetical protein
MSYGRLNIWLRDLDCTPRNFWKVDLVVKTCGGDYLVDFNPDVVAKLRRDFPPPRFSVKKTSMYGETTIQIKQPQCRLVIKHVELELPPGCYIVRAWVCWENMWSDRVMAIVDCGQTVCVNLLVPPRRHCFADVLNPMAVAALEMKLPPAKVNAAVEMLMKAGGVKKEAFVKDVGNLAKELKVSKIKEEVKYAEAFDSLASQVRTMRM